MIGHHSLKSFQKHFSASYAWQCSNNFQLLPTSTAGVNQLRTSVHSATASRRTNMFFRFAAPQFRCIDSKSDMIVVLRIIADWLMVQLKNGAELFVDINDCPAFQPFSKVFDSLRPDIAIKTESSIITLELTICHESNISSSKDYKINKYKNLDTHLLPSVAHCSLKRFTIEVTPLGFVSDISKFFKCTNLKIWPVETVKLIRESVISESYKIYCSRNSAT